MWGAVLLQYGPEGDDPKCLRRYYPVLWAIAREKGGALLVLDNQEDDERPLRSIRAGTAGSGDQRQTACD
jgi:hypothetical protein